MSCRKIQVLLVEDNRGDARLIQDLLNESPGVHFNLQIVEDMPSAVTCLNGGQIDVVLLDLHLPGTSGLDTFSSINRTAPVVPIVILSGLADRDLAEDAIAKGAQDYLVKGRISGDLLNRSINYSIERKKREEAYGEMVVALREAHDKLHLLSITDPLTGLCNRRGLDLRALQYIRLAKRNKQHAFVFFIDIDNMKWINDNLGHAQGDAVLIEVADILKQCFRETDIITRLGGDEFCVVMNMMNFGDENIILERLQLLLDKRNAACRSPQEPFFLSIGGSVCNVEGSKHLETILDEADKMMYIKKGSKRPKTGPSTI